MACTGIDCSSTVSSCTLSQYSIRFWQEQITYEIKSCLPLLTFHPIDMSVKFYLAVPKDNVPIALIRNVAKAENI